VTSRILALVLLSACTGSEAGNALFVSLVRGGNPGQGCPDGCNVQGGTVALRHAWVTVESVEIVPCATAASWLRRWLAPLPPAHAHEEGTPTRTSAPAVVDLMASDRVALGRLAPPADRYCSLRIVLGPPDGDAVNLPDPSVVGKTLVLDLQDDLRLSTAGSRSFTVALESSIDLTTARQLDLVVSVGAAGWITSIDTGSATAAEDVLARIEQGTSASLQVGL